MYHGTKLCRERHAEYLARQIDDLARRPPGSRSGTVRRRSVSRLPVGVSASRGGDPMAEGSPPTATSSHHWRRSHRPETRASIGWPSVAQGSGDVPLVGHERPTNGTFIPRVRRASLHQPWPRPRDPRARRRTAVASSRREATSTRAGQNNKRVVRCPKPTNHDTNRAARSTGSA